MLWVWKRLYLEIDNHVRTVTAIRFIHFNHKTNVLDLRAW